MWNWWGIKTWEVGGEVSMRNGIFARWSDTCSTSQQNSDHLSNKKVVHGPMTSPCDAPRQVVNDLNAHAHFFLVYYSESCALFLSFGNFAGSWSHGLDPSCSGPTNVKEKVCTSKLAFCQNTSPKPVPIVCRSKSWSSVKSSQIPIVWMSKRHNCVIQSHHLSPYQAECQKGIIINPQSFSLISKPWLRGKRYASQFNPVVDPRGYMWRVARHLMQIEACFSHNFDLLRPSGIKSWVRLELLPSLDPNHQLTQCGCLNSVQAQHHHCPADQKLDSVWQELH